jgi:hypothetical protein
MRNLVALLCAALLATAAVAAEPPVVENRAATPAQPKNVPAEEVIVTSKRPDLEVPPAVLAPIVHIATPAPCIEIGTKRCGTT